jgi:type I restriction enzyme R subunit
MRKAWPGGAILWAPLANEADTCRKYVLPKLKASGWTDELISEQAYFTDGRIIPIGRRHRRARGNKADYLLRYRPDFPIAIVEAKADWKLPGDGLQQAMDYSEILELKFAYSTNGAGIVEHDYTTGAQRDITAFPTPEELWSRYRENEGLSKDRDAEDYLFPFNRELRNPDGSIKTPRYFQRVAINRSIRGVLEGKKRLLLTMATGTGKTFTALQIVWKLWKTGRKSRILYLADRSILVDQPITREFSIFGDAVWKIQGEAKKGREIYFALYQAIAEDEGRAGLYRDYPPDYFDLIVVDECHRGSARDDSRWRGILDYFSPATQIGMTATPLRDDNVNTYEYFGAPLFTYSLAQGIDDGFLAPYRVHRIVTTADATGYRPEAGEVDRFGRAIPDSVYGTKDFERNLSLVPRTEAVARHLTNFLKRTNRFDKTIVFCVDQEHAEQVRAALHGQNEDLTREYPHYAARVTSDEGAVGRGFLDAFSDPEKQTTTILTTSQLLSTGVDIPVVRNIVLFRNIGSMVEFKQIIGRGTRIYEDVGKLFFSILDYVGATRLFADPAFDGFPEVESITKIDESGTEISTPTDMVREGEPGETGPVISDPPEPTARKLYVDEHTVEIAAEAVYDLDPETGKRLRAISYEEFSSEQIRKLFASATHLRSRWSRTEEREAIVAALQEKGIEFDHLAEVTGLPDADLLDLLLYVAWNTPARSRRERAEQVFRGKQRIFEKYSPAAREILQEILKKYSEFGPNQLHDLRILEVPPLSERGSPLEIAAAFGGPNALRIAISELEQAIYAA